MVFKTPQKKNVRIDPPNIDSTQIEEVTQMSFLGVVFDQHLSWKPHISYLATKIAKSAGIIYKCKFYLPKRSLLQLYYALVYPYLHYCNIVYGNDVYVTNLNRLILLQKKVVRTIDNADRLAFSQPIFKKLGLLTLVDINLFQKGVFMYCYCNHLLLEAMIMFSVLV
jgi:hypothetical protein